MKLKYVIPIIIFLSFSAFPQELISNFTWNFGFQTDKMSDYISDNSFKGFGIEFRKFITKQSTVGLSFGWNIFDQRIDEPIQIDQEGFGGTISGTQIRYINTFPLLANFDYFFGKRRSTRFFLGLNAGVYYILQRLDIGVWRLESNNWHLGFAPEAGIIVPFGDAGTHLIVVGRYNYAFDAGTSLGGIEDNTYQYYSLNFGLAFSNLF